MSIGQTYYQDYVESREAEYQERREAEIEMDNEECEHGYLLNDGCPYCEKESWGCDRYHALKDDGYY